MDETSWTFCNPLKILPQLFLSERSVCPRSSVHFNIASLLKTLDNTSRQFVPGFIVRGQVRFVAHEQDGVLLVLA